MTQDNSGEQVLQKAWDDTQWVLRTINRNGSYTIHPWGKGYLTTDGIQYGNITTGSTGVSSGSTATVTIEATTINIPGIVQEIDELELGLTCGLESSGGSGTLGFVWEMKSATATAWTIISTAREVASTKVWLERTVSGRVSTTTGNTKQPFVLRLRMWNKTASDGHAKVKNSSYVKVLSTKTSSATT